MLLAMMTACSARKKRGTYRDVWNHHNMFWSRGKLEPHTCHVATASPPPCSCKHTRRRLLRVDPCSLWISTAHKARESGHFHQEVKWVLLLEHESAANEELKPLDGGRGLHQRYERLVNKHVENPQCPRCCKETLHRLCCQPSTV